MLFKLIVIIVLGNSGISQHEYIFNSQEACEQVKTAFVSDYARAYLTLPLHKGEKPRDIRVLASCVKDAVSGL